MSADKMTSFTTLDLTDLKSLGKAAAEDARQLNHQQGIPFSKVVDEKLYHETSDGAMELIESLADEFSVSKE